MRRVFGLETEYGITIDKAESVDVVAESIELVRGYTEHGAHMKWDYDLEDPHRDARGFRAQELLQDADESAYFEIDRNRPLSFEEIKSDLVLSNGARFYNDHAHPRVGRPQRSPFVQRMRPDVSGPRGCRSSWQRCFDVTTEIFDAAFENRVSLSRSHQPAIERLRFLQMLKEEGHGKDGLLAGFVPIDPFRQVLVEVEPLLVEGVFLVAKVSIES